MAASIVTSNSLITGCVNTVQNQPQYSKAALELSLSVPDSIQRGRLFLNCPRPAIVIPVFIVINSEPGLVPFSPGVLR